MAGVPRKIGPYPVLGVLGEGGMGSVYLSRDPQSGCEVALKVLSAGRRATSAQRERFQREVRALSQLRHPSLIELLGSGEEGGVPWLAMRRVEGESLEGYLRTRERLLPREGAELGVQIGSALAAAHAVGILHRDLKPDNVLRTPAGDYVLTDFGLTKELDRDESIRLSRTGAAIGTPGYWAPEQAEGAQSEWSFATDVYGLGALLYAALTGVPPIRGESLLEVVVATRSRVPEPPSRLVAGIPPALDRILLRCLEKSPGDRYASLVEVVDDLEGFLYAEARSGAGRRPPRWALGLGVLVAGGALGLASASRSGPESARLAQSAGSSLPARPERATPSLGGVAALREAAAEGDPLACEALGRALVSEEPEEARRWLERALAAGRLGACGALGKLCLEGRGGGVDEARARALFGRGAEGGEVSCMAPYGKLLLRGLGGAKLPEEGLRWLRRAREAGDPEGAEGLAEAFRHGLGVEVDMKRAFALYSEAAAAGRLRSLRGQGTLHLRGEGTPKDPRQGFECYRRAAEAGYLPAFNDLGLLYRKGLGTPVDHAQANYWMRRGAEGGDSLAMFSLGVCHETGAGLPLDLEAARGWYRKAAEKGHPQGAYNLGVHLERLGRSEEAARWFREGAEAGYVPALTAMAEHLVAGHGVARDEAQARVYLERAAARGSAAAAFALGRLLLNGQGGEPDERGALRLFRQAASAEHPAALGALGACLLEGRLLPRDPVEGWRLIRRGAALADPFCMFSVGKSNLLRAERAGGGEGERYGREGVQLLLRAARGELAQAMHALGRELQRGRFVATDAASAYAWFERGAELGDLDCLVSQARCLTVGRGVPQDFARARDLYLRAAEEGSPVAMGQVGTFMVSGRGGAIELERGLAWVRRGAEASDPHSLFSIAYFYDKGQGLGADPVAARKWYLRAAEAGSSRAMNNLVGFLLNGRGGPVDEGQGMKWLRRAAEAGALPSMVRLGRRLIRGEGVPADPEEGRGWLERSLLECKDPELIKMARTALDELAD